MWDAEKISAVANIVTALATFGAVTVAGLGLRTWKQELKGRADFEAATALARTTYALRIALRTYRSPVLRFFEFPDGDMSSGEGYAQLYGKRWDSVSECLASFDAAALEAEVLWGAKVLTATERLRACVTTVFVATEAFIEDKRSNGENFKADAEFARKIRSEVSGGHDSTKNPLSLEIQASVEEIERFLRPHLQR